MSRIIKWPLIISGALVVVILALLLLAPMFINAQIFRPKIENLVSEATGLPFSLEGKELYLSLLPRASLAIGDFHFSNPPGFEEKDLLLVKSFELRVKLLPLFSRDLQVKRFILKGARIVLERSKKGKANWESLAQSSPDISQRPKKGPKSAAESKPREGLLLNAVSVGEFDIIDSSLLWIDNTKGERREITDISLRLQDVSLERPVHIIFSAQLDGQPLSLDGYVGPIGKDLGKGTVPLDISVKALKQLDMKLKGDVISPAASPRLDLAVNVSEFSPRETAEKLGKDFPITTADPGALNRIAVKARLKGDIGNVSVSDGVLLMDESTLNFSGKAGNFSRPDVTFAVSLDEIDLDRYLPPKDEKQADESNTIEEKPAAQSSGAKKTDYSPLQRLVLNGSIRMGKLTVQNVDIHDLSLQLVGRNGVFNIDPLTFKAFQGDISVIGDLNVKQNVPKSAFKLTAKGIRAGPLLKDILEKDILEGTAHTEITLHMTGDDAEKFKKTLNGKGDLFIEEGAIKGIDLVGMVRNTDGAYGFARGRKKQRRTEFTELHVPFTIENGVLNTLKTSMMSEVLRVQTTGTADLMKEALDFRVEPTFVTTSKEDEEEMERSEIMIPVLVSGTFSSPKFHPDLKGLAKQKLEEEIFESSKFKKVFEKEKYKPFEKQAKDLLRGILDIPESEEKE